MARPYRRRAVLSITRAYSHDPLERVDAIAGVNADRSTWRLSQSAAIAAIEARTDEFYVTDGGLEVKLVVVKHREQKYLKSERETTHPDELLTLLTGR